MLSKSSLVRRVVVTSAMGLVSLLCLPLVVSTKARSGAGMNFTVAPLVLQTLTSITVAPGTFNTSPGQLVQFTAQCRDQNGQPLACPPLTWASSDPSKLSVNSAGLATAAAAGSANVTASGSGVTSGAATVTVLDRTLQSVGLWPASAKTALGNRQNFHYHPYDSNGKLLVGLTATWVSSDNGVASFAGSDNGNRSRDCNAVAAGTTNVSVLVGTNVPGTPGNGGTSPSRPLAVVDQSAAPVAVLEGSGTTTTVRQGQVVLADARNSQGLAWFRISWGDGTTTEYETISGAAGVHSYWEPGTYQITVTVRNLSGQEATSPARTVVVQPHAFTRTRHINSSECGATPLDQCLQNALNDMQTGDDIVLPAGQTLVRGDGWTIPERPLTGFVRIRSSSPALQNLSWKKRVDPATTEVATLKAGYTNYPVVTFLARSKFILFDGVKFEPGGLGTYYVINVGQTNQETSGSVIGGVASNRPADIILKHCVVNPPNGVYVGNALAASAVRLSVISSAFVNIWSNFNESKAVWGTDPDDVSIVNTWLQASAINFMWGGSTGQVHGHVPSDTELRWVYFSKKPSWYNDGQTWLKNWHEYKTGLRAYADSCVYDYTFQGAQGQYYGIVPKSSDQYNDTPWAMGEDLHWRNIKARHMSGGVSAVWDQYNSQDANNPGPTGCPRPNHITFTNALFDDINSAAYGITGNFYLVGGAHSVRFRHVTALPDNKLVVFATWHDQQNTEIFDSILRVNEYGIKTDSVGKEGTDSLNVATSNKWRLHRNGLVYYSPANPAWYPNGTPNENHLTLTNVSQVQFANLAAGDYTLLPASPYKTYASTDGKDIGVDMAALNAATLHTVDGDWSASSPSGASAVVFNGVNQNAKVTLPNSAPYTSVGGFQVIWRQRGAGDGGRVWMVGDIFTYLAGTADPKRFDFHEWRENVPVWMPPADYQDSVCKLQYDPANSRWTFETWKPDGTGYVLRTTAITNISNWNFGGQVLSFGSNPYNSAFAAVKLDYWRWITRVEPVGVFPTANAPTGVTYLGRFEFDGNGGDASGNGINLTLNNSPPFEPTP